MFYTELLTVFTHSIVSFQIQFMLIGLHALTALVIKNCEYPIFMTVLISLQSIIMFKLFYDFYQRAYMKKIK
jgi:hypothetical protein